MTENSLFTPTTPTTPQLDPNKNFLEELVGEGKKFADVQALARGKYEADLFIESKNRQFDTLAEDYKTLREQYNAGPKLQEVIDKLLAGKQTSSSDNTLPNEDLTKSTFDPAQLDTMLDEKISKREIANKAAANEQVVKDKLQERFGDRFPEMLADQTQKLGLTQDKVLDLARSSPSAFFRLLGLEDTGKTETFQSPPRSSQMTAFAPTGSKNRKWSEWKETLRKQPNLHSDPKTHKQMLEDIKAVGEKAFYDVN